MKLSPSLRQIVSRALVLCGKHRVTSLSEDREDIAVALEMAYNVINTSLMMGYFYEGEKVATLTLIPEADRRNVDGLPYFLPNDFLAVRRLFVGPATINPVPYTNSAADEDVFKPSAPIFLDLGYYLESDYIVTSYSDINAEGRALKLQYVSDETLRYKDLFIKYASARLASEICDSIGSLDSLSNIIRIKDEAQREVAALSHDSTSWGKGNSFFSTFY